jgi:hypothetical protein
MPKTKLNIDASSTGEPNVYIHPGLLEELATERSVGQFPQKDRQHRRVLTDRAGLQCGNLAFSLPGLGIAVE